MAQSEIPRDKIEAYEATHYRVGSGPDAFVLRIGQHSPELERLYLANELQNGLFITAFNPLGQKQGDDTNASAHALLGAHLHRLSRAVIEGSGADPTGAWSPEASYLALGIGAERGRDLGRLYRQDAVVWVDEGAIPQLLLLR